MYERIQQGLAHGDLRVVPGVDAQQLLESGMGLVVEVDVVVGLAELPHKGLGELPAVLEHALVRPLENGRLDGVRALVGQEQAEVRVEAVLDHLSDGCIGRRDGGVPLPNVDALGAQALLRHVVGAVRAALNLDGHDRLPVAVSVVA